MIGVIICLISMYRFIFTDWSLTPEQGFMLLLAAIVELAAEAGVVNWAAQCYLEKRKQEK